MRRELTYLIKDDSIKTTEKNYIYYSCDDGNIAILKTEELDSLFSNFRENYWISQNKGLDENLKIIKSNNYTILILDFKFLFKIGEEALNNYFINLSNESIKCHLKQIGKKDYEAIFKKTLTYLDSNREKLVNEARDKIFSIWLDLREVLFDLALEYCLNSKKKLGRKLKEELEKNNYPTIHNELISIIFKDNKLKEIFKRSLKDIFTGDVVIKLIEGSSDKEIELYQLTRGFANQKKTKVINNKLYGPSPFINNNRLKPFLEHQGTYFSIKDMLSINEMIDLTHSIRKLKKTKQKLFREGFEVRYWDTGRVFEPYLSTIPVYKGEINMNYEKIFQAHKFNSTDQFLIYNEEEVIYLTGILISYFGEKLKYNQKVSKYLDVRETKELLEILCDDYSEIRVLEIPITNSSRAFFSYLNIHMKEEVISERGRHILYAGIATPDIIFYSPKIEKGLDSEED